MYYDCWLFLHILVFVSDAVKELPARGGGGGVELGINDKPFIFIVFERKFYFYT